MPTKKVIFGIVTAVLVLVIAALISIIFAIPAMAQSSEMAVAQCLKLPSHAESRACLEAKVKESDSILDHTETAFLSTLTHWDEEAQYKSRSVTQLQASVSKFAQYRESQCEFLSSLAAGGNGAGDRRLLCHIGLNQRRIAELREAQDSLK